MDVVLNHMTATYSEIKTAYAGSKVDTVNFEYPAVPYTKADFHESCLISEMDVETVSNPLLNTFQLCII